MVITFRAPSTTPYDQNERMGEGVIDRYDMLAPSDALSVSDWIPMQLPLDCARADVEADELLPTK